MKFYLILLTTSLFFNISFGQDAGAIVTFDKEIINLGTVTKGDMVKNQFVFTNISDENVRIDLVSTCECTEAKWTTGAIKPGEQGKIDFIFDSNKKDVAEPVDVDVHFRNINPDSGIPYKIYLQYLFEFDQ